MKFHLLNSIDRRQALGLVAGAAVPGLLFDQNIGVKANATNYATVSIGRTAAIEAVGASLLAVNVHEYGARGDWISGTGTGTDNLSAFNAAFADLVAKGGGLLYIPAGKYRFSAGWNIYRSNNPRIDIVIVGEDQLTTFLISDYFGADKTLVSSIDPERLSRSSPTTLRNLQFGSVSRSGGVTPVYLDILGHGESRMDGIRFGPSNNTHVRVCGAQNVRYRDIVSYYGGKNFLYRATNGISFSLSGKQVTASADAFTANDGGRMLELYPTEFRNQGRVTIARVQNPRTATIGAATSMPAVTAAKGSWEGARATMTAGSNILAANARCFNPEDVGRVIYVRNARTASGAPAMLRATIKEYVGAATVRLDRPATRAVTREPFATPVFDFYTDMAIGERSAVSGFTNDVKIDLLHVETYAGLAMAVQDATYFYINEMKIHGAHNPADALTSNGALWLDDMAGVISGDLDGRNPADSRIHVSNMGVLLTIPWLTTRRVRNEILLTAEYMPNKSALTEIKSLSFVNYEAADPVAIVNDKNVAATTSRKVVYTGTVTSLAGDSVGNLSPRIYSGMDTYFSVDGGIIMTASNGSRYRLVIGASGTVTTTAV